MINFYLSGNPTHDTAIKALYDGCPEEKSLRDFATFAVSDVAVIYGMRKKLVPISWPRGEIYDAQREAGKDVIVIDTGYINRGPGPENHYAVGLNGLNGRADFRNKGMTDDRATKLRQMHAFRTLNWRESGEHIVLCGQVPWDAAVDHTDHVAWLYEAVASLKAKTKREIRFRPHPLAVMPPLEPEGQVTYSTVPLSEDLIDAHACVTFNSNSGVEAAIEGVPVFASDIGSMAWEVANYDWKDIERPELPYRGQWLNDLAYTQWQPSEMAEGLTWKHLFRSKVDLARAA